MTKIQTFLASLIGFSYLFSSFPGTTGLECYTCYPCNGDQDGTLETCDEASYANLPDKGYHGCSYEVAAGNTRRKRCIWLRIDPDDDPNPPVPRPLQCSLSPMDDVSHDCYCFTDGCNNKKLEPPTTTTTPSPGKPNPGGPQRPGATYNHGQNTRATNSVHFRYTLGIVLIGISFL